MADNRFTKPVAFNSKNETDNKILGYKKAKRNFSGFAKEAMLEYIERREGEKELKKNPPKKLSRLEELKKRTEKASSPRVFLPGQDVDK